ncbi:MAG TPA: hypothetical protein VIZ65_11475 [Cellvibrionaceae bacterium]
MSEKDILINNDDAFRIYQNDSNDLCIAVLTGGVGVYEAKIKLLEEDIIKHHAAGDSYYIKLAKDIRMHPSKYANRYIP